MLRMYFSCILLAATLIVQGCATLPPPEKVALELKDYKLPQQIEKDKALIYVVRPSSLGTLIRFEVYLDGEDDVSKMGYTRGNQHIYFYADPGHHVIRSNAENWAEFTIDAKEGDVIFLMQDVQPGVLYARNSLGLMNTMEGKYYVKNTSLGTIIKTHK